MGSVPVQIPTSFGHDLRACLRCRLVKTYDQFRESGCENCSFFKMDEDHERVVDCTTPNFNGKVGPCLLHSLFQRHYLKTCSIYVKMNWYNISYRNVYEVPVYVI